MLRVLLTVCLLLPGCGLIPPAPIDFRAYPLADVPPSEAVGLVRDVVHDVFTARFGGGFSMAFDDEQKTLTAGPVEVDQRRLTLHLVFTPLGEGTTLEMLALVESMGRADTGMIAWGRPMQDVYFEEKLYEAIIEEQLERADAP